MSFAPQGSGGAGAGGRSSRALLYKGALDARTGTYPSGSDQGDYYIVSHAGTVSGTAYTVGDWAIFNGSTWDKIDAVDVVNSVDSKTGNVDLSSSYLGLTAKAADSNLLDGMDSLAFATTAHNHDVSYLGLHAKADDSSLLDGIDSTGFLAVGAKAADSDKLDGLNSDVFALHTTATQTIWVYEDAIGTGDGSTKANGYTTLQAAIDSLPDVCNHTITIKVAKGSTNYLGQTAIVRGNDDYTGGIGIVGENYASGSCESNAVAGKIVDVDGTFTGLLPGDRVVCSKYSGTVENSSIEDYFYATVTETGAGYCQTSERTKIPTTGWTYVINQTVMDGNNSTSDIPTIRFESPVSGVSYISFQNMPSYGNNSCGSLSFYSKMGNVWECIFLNTCGISVYHNTLVTCGRNAFINSVNFPVVMYYGCNLTVWWCVFHTVSTAYDTLYITNTSQARIMSSGFFNTRKAVNIDSGCICTLYNCYIDASCLTGVYGYNTTLVSCTNNATTPETVLISGGKIADSTLWNTQALPTLEANKFLQVKSDGTGFQLTSVATGDVVGPSSAVGGNLATFNSTTGKLIKDSGSKVGDFATSGHTHTDLPTDDQKAALSGTSGTAPSSTNKFVDNADTRLTNGRTDTNAVHKADYDANTILAATTDDTPIAVTITEQTLLGRITGGVITALSVSQIKTLLGLGGAAVLNVGTTTGTVAAGDDSRFGTGGSGITWTEVTGTTVTLAADTGYIANNAALVTGTLPSTCAVGKVIAIVGKGAGLWKIAQNANQYIRFGSLTSTVGTGGYIAAVGQYDCLDLICTTADVGFTVRSSIGYPDVI